MSKSYAEHSFYCIACGQRGLPIQRQLGHQHKSMHRKKLYCIHCRKEVNHIECKNFYEVEKFKSNFEKGIYQEEAKVNIYE